jgi:hypothetical protein
VRIFVPSKAEEGERFGARPVMLCSEAAENDGAGVTEAAEEVRGAEVEARTPRGSP